MTSLHEFSSGWISGGKVFLDRSIDTVTVNYTESGNELLDAFLSVTFYSLAYVFNFFTGNVLCDDLK